MHISELKNMNMFSGNDAQYFVEKICSLNLRRILGLCKKTWSLEPLYGREGYTDAHKQPFRVTGARVELRGS